MYIIGVRDKNYTYTIYVNFILYNNTYFQGFKNTTINFTDSIEFALKIKDINLAEALASSIQRNDPTLDCEVLKVSYKTMDLYKGGK